MKTTSGQDALTTRPVAEVLRKALEAFGPNGENWVTGTGGDAPKCCAVTSFDRIGMSAFSGGDQAYRLLCRTVEVEEGFLSSWNDSRTWPEVKAAFEAAIAKAGGQ